MGTPSRPAAAHSPASPGAFTVVDPKSGAAIGQPIAESTAADVDRAATRAEEAFAAMRGRSGAERAKLLEAIAERIAALGDALIERAGQETALPAARLASERGRTVNQLRLFAELAREGSWVDARIDRAQPQRQPAPRPDLRRMLVGIGPVAVFGASNFPLAFSTAGGDTAAALAAGCPVVFKAHPAHAHTAELVAGAIREAIAATGFPEGAFAQVQGTTTELGKALVTHPLIRAGAFTGSLRGGRALFDLASQRPEPMPFFAEMGSINPLFLLPGALAARGAAIAEGLHRSLTLGVGQFCTNPGLTVVLADPATEAFIAKLAGLIGATAPGTLLHAGIGQAYQASLARLDATSSLRRLARVDAAAGAAGTNAGAVLYAVDAAAFLARPELREEVFGPCGLIVIARDLAELERVARSLPGQLTAGIHASAEELPRLGALLAALERIAGRVLFDDFPTGVEVCAAMHHGGPYPATTDARATSVGTAAIQRFARPVCWQNAPAALLPAELRDANPLGILRQIDGAPKRDALG
jgi:NADP-dependent aldehyde dehydrogenase